MIGVYHAGINVYEDQMRVNRFLWQTIIKISYRHNRFKIKLRKGEVSLLFDMFAHFRSSHSVRIVVGDSRHYFVLKKPSTL